MDHASSPSDRPARSSQAVSAAARALTEYFVGDSTLGDTLNRVAELTKHVLPQAMFVGITILVNGKVGTEVYTHPQAAEIDAVQHDTDDGPGLDAYRHNVPVRIPHTRTSDTYPSFCAAALERGVASTLSVPLRTERGTFGAMNLYAAQDDAFSDEDVDYATAFASQAAFLVTNAQAYWDARTLADDLRTAMATRAEIEQAKGIIIATTGCTAEEAFEQLRAQSQHENRKLRDIATELVNRSQRRHRP